MQPCPSSRGTAAKRKKKLINQSVSPHETKNGVNGPLTSVESASNSHADDGECEETGHRHQNLTALVVNGVDTDDMDGGADGEKDCGTNGFKEVEV